MTDAATTDLARFYQRYDLRQRLLFAASLSASLVLSAVNFVQGPLTSSGSGAKAAPLLWGFGIMFPPLAIAAWWAAQEFIARWRDRRPPMRADDAPNGLRIANAGFLFSVALVACVFGAQAVVTLAALGHPVGDLIPRASLAAFGVALICLGNVWPRMPEPRVSEPKAATRMKVNRTWGWVMVLMGLGLVLQGLGLPLLDPLVRTLHAHG